MAIHTFGANGAESTLSNVRKAQEEVNDEDVDLGAVQDQEMRDEGTGSKAKAEKYLDEERQKQENIAGTFGDGSLAFNFEGPKIKVDKDCKMKKNFSVFQDYSCVLSKEDVEYSMIS